MERIAQQRVLTNLRATLDLRRPQLLADLRAFASAAGGRAPTLPEFLGFTGQPLPEVLKRGLWSRLLHDAGLRRKSHRPRRSRPRHGPPPPLPPERPQAAPLPPRPPRRWPVPPPSGGERQATSPPEGGGNRARPAVVGDAPRHPLGRRGQEDDPRRSRSPAPPELHRRRRPASPPHPPPRHLHHTARPDRRPPRHARSPRSRCTPPTAATKPSPRWTSGPSTPAPS